MRSLLLPLIGSLALATHVPAADVVLAPGDSIQSAIDAAAPADRVLLQPGTYVGQIDFAGKAIEVIGLGGAGATVLDGAGSGPVVRFVAGEGQDSRLAGVTVRGGSAAIGAGGIQCSGSTPTVEDCVVRNNTGKFGGGVSGDPILRRCIVLQNTASLTHGGGLYGAPQLSQCVIANNRATSADGGGMYLTGDTTIDRCVIVGNAAVFAGSNGGGIYVGGSANVTISNSLIVENFSTGGVFLGRGGGISASANTQILNCTVIGNSVSGSSTAGAGIYGFAGAELTNCIVRNNAGGSQISDDPFVSYSDVQGGAAGPGNFDLDPLFVDVAGSDLHLAVGSPAIDAGDPALLDPDGSRSDVGAFPFQSFYLGDNLPESRWSNPSWAEVPLLTGGGQALELAVGAQNALDLYLVLGSRSGTQPGLALGALVLPLNVDGYLLFTLNNPNSAVLGQSLGQLDSEGRAEALLSAPPGTNPALAGLTLHHAALVVDTATIPEVVLVTNAVAAPLID